MKIYTALFGPLHDSLTLTVNVSLITYQQHSKFHISIKIIIFIYIVIILSCWLFPLFSWMFKTGHVILYHPIRLNVSFCLSKIRNYFTILRYMKRSDSYAQGQSSPILLVSTGFTGVAPSGISRYNIRGYM